MWQGQRGKGIRGEGLVSTPEMGTWQPTGLGFRCRAQEENGSGRDRGPGVGSSASCISLSSLQDGSVGSRSGEIGVGRVWVGAAPRNSVSPIWPVPSGPQGALHTSDSSP